MPFLSPKQQIFMKINHPSIHDRWQKEYGNAKGLSEYMKRVRRKKSKKSKKNAAAQIALLQLANHLDSEGFTKIADKIETVTSQLENIEASCIKCNSPIGNPVKCNSCGWTETSLCPLCTMKKIGGELCPDCGGKINIPKTIEAKTLTYKEKQASPCVFPKSHPKITDGKDHFPIPDVSHGANALARCQQFSSSPDWFSGSLKELQNIIKQKVYEKFPGLKSRNLKHN